MYYMESNLFEERVKVHADLQKLARDRKIRECQEQNRKYLLEGVKHRTVVPPPMTDTEAYDRAKASLLNQYIVVDALTPEMVMHNIEERERRDAERLEWEKAHAYKATFSRYWND